MHNCCLAFGPAIDSGRAATHLRPLTTHAAKERTTATRPAAPQAPLCAIYAHRKRCFALFRCRTVPLVARRRRRTVLPFRCRIMPARLRPAAGDDSTVTPSQPAAGGAPHGAARRKADDSNALPARRRRSSARRAAAGRRPQATILTLTPYQPAAGRALHGAAGRRRRF